jgi:shikimate dehydrogenase
MNATDAIAATTRFCAVFGQPVRHSASPAMHNAALAALGLDWRYLAFEVPPAQLREAIEGCRAMRFLGVNLTVPHKLLALDLMDELDFTAREWGAVNTVRFEAQNESGEWLPLGRFGAVIPDRIRTVGFNTDADAILRSLEDDLGLRASGLRVVILGAGGAGRVAALRLASAGAAELHLVNRTESKLGPLREEIARRFPATQVYLGYPSGKVDLVLNATSLGLKASDGLPVDLARFDLQQAGAAYDMIYRPAETPFLAEARRRGCRTANGLGMLLYQGARALELWSGRPAPIEAMHMALKQQIYG